MAQHFDRPDKSCYDYGCTDDCPVIKRVALVAKVTWWQRILLALVPHERGHTLFAAGIAGGWEPGCDVDGCHQSCSNLRLRSRFLVRNIRRRLPRARSVTMISWPEQEQKPRARSSSVRRQRT